MLCSSNSIMMDGIIEIQGYRIMAEGRTKSMSHLSHVSLLAIREPLQAKKLRKQGVQFSLLLL